jgi:hypothetical protein
VIPTAAEQAAFAAQIAKSQKSKAYYREQIAAFDSLFSSLQSRAFSGQL